MFFFSVLQEKFRNIDQLIKDSLFNLEKNINNLEPKADSFLNSKSLEIKKLIDEKREELIERLNKNELESFENVTKKTYQTFVYFKSSEKKLILNQTYSIKYKNDLSVYRKLLNLDFLRCQLKRINIPIEYQNKSFYRFYMLSSEKYLIQDLRQSELSVFARSNNQLLSKISYKEKYMIFIETFEQKILITFSIMNLNSYIYLLDHDLNTIKHKCIPNCIANVISIDKESFSFFLLNINEYFIMNYDLEITRTLNSSSIKTSREMFFYRFGPIVGFSKNRLLTYRFYETETCLEILSHSQNSDYNVINSIALNLNSLFKVNMDCNENIYLRMRSRNGEQFCLYCYDSNGVELFQKIYTELNDQIEFKLFNQSNFSLVEHSYRNFYYL
jgi:hypothetical protein